MTTDADDAQGERPLRRDAARNRELILRTAVEVFAEQGIDAGYDEIARRAGVGVGTVYRRFPERAELVRALFDSRIGEIVALAEEALTYDDAFEGLAWFLEQALAQQVADRGLKEVLAQTITADDHEAVGRDRLGPVIETLVAGAKDSGRLRPDIAATDLGAQLMVMSVMTTPDVPDLWRRYLALFLDAIRARPGQAPLPLEAPSDGAMHDLMGNLQGR